MRSMVPALLLVCAACAAAVPAPAPVSPRVEGPAARAAAQREPAPLALASTSPFSEAIVAPSPAPLAPTPDADPPAEACAESEVAIPPTSAVGFVMSKGGKGAHKVVLSHGFCMDVSEVTVREFTRCVEAGACKEPWKGDPYSTYPARLDEPVNLVNWSKAHAFCAWAGKRLPTEAEWEWAATGPEQYRYPWGNEPEPSCDTCDYTKFGAPKWEAGGDIGCGGGGPSTVGTHPKGDRVWPGGAVHDLAGNVWEWIEDAYAPLSSDPVTDPVVRLEVPLHVIRGGGWNRSYAAMVVTYRGAAHYSYQVPALGFRCVRGEPLTTPSPHYE